MALPNNNGSVIVADSVRKDEEFSGTRPVEERHRIDEARLDGWLKENVEGYQGPLSVLQFKGGQSNPTYRLDTPGRSYVMRRRPFGKLLPSAHAVDREFRVIAALSKQGLSGCEGHALCTDDGVIGSAFTSCRWKRAGYLVTAATRRRMRVGKFSPADRDARQAACSIRRSGSAISASLAIILPARSIAGPSNTAPPRRSTSGIREARRMAAQTVPQQERVSIVHSDYRLTT
jgi:aminoglycoside phosphotransferase (APT) family kinase protein